ncbi:MAG TPA: lysylphosphatidylglycerol synthase domain-containing protein [Gemmataceae bacterium]
MRDRRRTWWRWLRVALAVAIVGGVGWQFARLLAQPELWNRPWRLRPGWLAACVGCYLAGLACWGAFWLRLLHRVGLRTPVGAAFRAYYVSHLGKYVPGKAWAIVMRATLLPCVRPGTAALTAAYETLTTMAAGALIAAGVIPWLLAGQESLGAQALGLLALAGLPLLPGVFNAVIARVARPFVDPADPLPRVRWTALPEGLAITAVGWAWLGMSVLALVQALIPDAPAPSPGFAARCLAFNALSYVAGFLALPAPGGLGVREAIFQQLLAAELRATHPEGQVAAGLAALAVVVLRLVWTAADLLAAAVAYARPARPEGQPCSPS